MNKKIVCVTGASGMIGKRIVSNLVSQGLHVRILSFRKNAVRVGIESFTGDLGRASTLVGFLDGANCLFHCAGELNDIKKMQRVNVDGTKNLFELALKSNLQYFCHISSAGVIGNTSLQWVDERAPCNPQNEYERTKHNAEQLTKEKIPNCTTVILRPVNVMDKERPDVFGLPLRNSFKDRLFASIKGRECAHQVHAGHVANVATFFINSSFEKPEVFFVGNDEDENNTYQGIWNLYSKLRTDKKISPIKYTFPLWVPDLLRKLQGIVANKGDVRYSSKKLSLHGIENMWSLTKIVEDMIKSDRKVI